MSYIVIKTSAYRTEEKQESLCVCVLTTAPTTYEYEAVLDVRWHYQFRGWVVVQWKLWNYERRNEITCGHFKLRTGNISYESSSHATFIRYLYPIHTSANSFLIRSSLEHCTWVSTWKLRTSAETHNKRLTCVIKLKTAFYNITNSNTRETT